MESFKKLPKMKSDVACYAKGGKVKSASAFTNNSQGNPLYTEPKLLGVIQVIVGIISLAMVRKNVYNSLVIAELVVL